MSRTSLRARAHAALPLALAVALGLGVAAVGLGVGVSPAAAHEERPAVFPDGTSEVPRFLGYDNPRRRVVCADESPREVRRMRPGTLKRANKRLLRECRYSSIQTAINSISRRGTSVYVLPGSYDETRWGTDRRSDYCSRLATESDDPLLAAEYIGSLSSPDSGASAPEDDGTSDPIALSYADQRRCSGNLNLISVFGDRTPRNDSIACDSKFCGTQLVGTGADADDVLVDNRFRKLNALRVDRAGGFYLRRMTFEQAEFNAIYVLETDGFVIDDIVARANDEYGILAFASDHGLIKNSEAYFNGDSGIYPGSGADINADNENFEPTRYAIEIKRNSSHDNTLGYSGTAGNSIYAHHNDFFNNATGIATDSLFPGHPGLPQDHARWSRNRIFSNNSNYYTEFVDTGVCAKPMPERGYAEGTVCPVVPTPVGTGVLIAGGNYNSTDHNWIYDNWRHGTMQFWVPAVLRDEFDPTKQLDTSNHNRTFANHMGTTPAGRVLENGSDHWWDDQGLGNCWEDNEYADGRQDDNFVVPPLSCDQGGSVLIPGLTVKDAGFLSCSQYDRNDPTWRHPPQCNWFDSPTRPGSARAAAVSSGTAAGESDTPSLLLAPLTGLGLLLLARRRPRPARRAS